jgi:NAD(P)H-hydrate epimerase
MIKIVTAEEMQKMDRFAIEEIGIPGVVLMENAGLEIARIIMDYLLDMGDPLVHIFCGKGNNGGDGFVVARHLSNHEIDTVVFCVVKEEQIKGDALINYKVIKKMGIPIEFISSNPDLDAYLDNEVPDLLVDALLGTGIKGAVRGFVKEVIEAINDFEIPVVSIDLPSGLNADTGKVEGSAIFSDITVTMALPKRCHIFYPAKNYVGELHIADIGAPQAVLSNPDVKVQLVEQENIRIPSHPADSHKYQCGKVAVLAGSPGYTGAAVLTSKAALKMGAGLVILGIPEKLNPILEQKLTEVITKPLSGTNASTIGKHNLSEIKELLDWCDVLAIGPGLGRTEEVQETIIEILKISDKPAVIDADALFALANHSEIFNEGEHSNWILTPHAGEFLRFLRKTSKEELAERPIDQAQSFATKHKLTLMLKGAPSIVAAPDGNVFINSTGNAGLASGGSGDVLTGLIAGLVAQKQSLTEAAYTANFLHGFTADYFVKLESQHSLIAGDLVDNLGKVINFLSKE